MKRKGSPFKSGYPENFVGTCGSRERFGACWRSGKTFLRVFNVQNIAFPFYSICESMQRVPTIPALPGSFQESVCVSLPHTHRRIALKC